MSRQTEREPPMCAAARLPRASLVMLALTLTSACATTGGSETERAICDELRASLPSWSGGDTVQSRTEGADFLDVFEAVCGEAS